MNITLGSFQERNGFLHESFKDRHVILPLPQLRGNGAHCGIAFSGISGMDIKKRTIFHLLLAMLAGWFGILCFSFM
jgi:hypothetical protein